MPQITRLALETHNAIPAFGSLRASLLVMPARPQRISLVFVSFEHHNGQAFHNLLADIYRDHGKVVDSVGTKEQSDNPYQRPELLDPPLLSFITAMLFSCRFCWEREGSACPRRLQ